jgi:hypothetical protein
MDSRAWLEAWLRDHNVPVEDLEPKRIAGGKLRWRLTQCPWNPEHTRVGDAAIVLHPSGTIGARCFHAHCAGNGWREFREVFEPGCYSGRAEARPATPPLKAPVWPAPPEPEAYHGLAGDIVRALEPHTEADPVAILIQVLVAFGSVTGRLSYYTVEGTRHYANLFAVLVGDTSKARKGTSWDHVQRLFASVDESWSKGRVAHGGLSSGEGLIWAVRDPIYKREKISGGRGKPPEYDDVLVDPGVEDKRFLVVESEFAAALRVMEREGNTLSPVVRNAWDRGDLQSITKNSPAKATGAHVSIIGHITADELRRYLSATESANGYGNRHIWLCVQRSRCLPDGGKAHLESWTEIVNRLRAAVGRSASYERELRRDETTGKAWAEIYPNLSEGHPGLLGSVLARAEAQVLRLSMIYAMLDMSDVIRVEHLAAGVALWEYAERSAAHIFGDSTGDPVADEILRALRARKEGLARSDLSDLFSRNRSKERIGQALGLLLERKLVGFKKLESGEKGGRPTELWLALPSATPGGGGYLDTLRGFLRISYPGSVHSGSEQRDGEHDVDEKNEETSARNPDGDAKKEETHLESTPAGHEENEKTPSQCPSEGKVEAPGVTKKEETASLPDVPPQGPAEEMWL